MAPTRQGATAAAMLLLFFLPVVANSLPERARSPSIARKAEYRTNCTASTAFEALPFPEFIDSSLFPDYWKTNSSSHQHPDPRISTNGEVPEQLVKVTDKRHRFPVFATVCSLAFLVTIISIIVLCTQ